MGSIDKVSHPIVFFDGVCNLCNSSVQFIIRREGTDTFRFAALQSDVVQELLPAKYREQGLQSLILLEDAKVYTKSSAVLRISRRLSGLWPLFSVFIFVPKFLRDFMYDLIARNRYRWFGKTEQCMVPNPHLKSKFID